jgi:hypothetical protein
VLVCGARGLAIARRTLIDETAREGARRMLVAALEAEVATDVDAHRAERVFSPS